MRLPLCNSSSISVGGAGDRLHRYDNEGGATIRGQFPTLFLIFYRFLCPAGRPVPRRFELPDLSSVSRPTVVSSSFLPLSCDVERYPFAHMPRTSDRASSYLLPPASALAFSEGDRAPPACAASLRMARPDARETLRFFS